MNINIVKQKINNCEIVIQNDKSVNDLNRVLSELFPDDYSATGSSAFYGNWKGKDHRWFPVNYTDLPKVKVSEITFDVNHLDELKRLRKEYPNNLLFGDEFDKYINKLL